VEEHEFLEVAAGKKQLVDFAAPFFRRDNVEVPGEVNIHVPGLCPSTHIR
jgi:hypothetical protein